MSDEGSHPHAEKLLLIDDDPVIHGSVEAALHGQGYEVASAFTAAEGSQLLAQEHFELVLLDLNLPDEAGLDWLKRLRQDLDPEVPVVVVTAHGTVKAAVQALQLGAQDFVTKPFGVPELRAVVRRALTLTTLQRELRAARRQLSGTALAEVLAVDPKMTQVLDLARRVAASSTTTVLLCGETGVGKGLLARAIHSASPRASRPFVTINCAALPDELVEAELFGVEKGAFTDAAQPRAGLVEEAAGGTLFLDEVGQMPLKTQSKVLTLLEDRTIRRLGSARERTVDVRLIAATNSDLEADIAEGRFRSDLYYRLNVFTLTVPPLRERPEDVPVLAQQFVEQLSGEMGRRPVALGESALEALRAHAWPGNVRELRNCLERAVLLASGQEIEPADLGLVSVQLPPAEATDSVGQGQSLAEAERRHLLAVLEQCDGNRTHAAEILGIARETLQRKLKEWGRTGG